MAKQETSRKDFEKKKKRNVSWSMDGNKVFEEDNGIDREAFPEL